MLRLALGQPINPELLRRAAELRRHMTPEERIVWQELRGNRLGVHFRRPQPLAPYIADFYCHQARLVVEIDGSPHCRQQGYYNLRDAYLNPHWDTRAPSNESVGPQRSALSNSCYSQCVAARALTPDPFPGGEGEQEKLLYRPIPLTPFP